MPVGAALPLAVGHFTEDGYDYSLWYETIMARTDAGADFLRVMMVPLIDGCYTTYSEADRLRARERFADDPRKLEYLPLDEFRARFYPGEAPRVVVGNEDE